ncbi:MAG: hypothetical protein PS018_20510 [bacterium]|nr:hypothetical protein [bacterium]
MTNVPTEIRSLARRHTRTAIRVLVGVMRSEQSTPAARVTAASAILDRGWGRVAQPRESGSDGPGEQIHVIERSIVHPAISVGEGTERSIDDSQDPDSQGI